jgi:uncharacterized protein YneF (UPF0154 family)
MLPSYFKHITLLDILEITLALTAGVLLGNWFHRCQCDYEVLNAIQNIQRVLEGLQ